MSSNLCRSLVFAVLEARGNGVWLVASRRRMSSYGLLASHSLAMSCSESAVARFGCVAQFPLWVAVIAG